MSMAPTHQGFVSRQLRYIDTSIPAIRGGEIALAKLPACTEANNAPSRPSERIHNPCCWTESMMVAKRCWSISGGFHCWIQCMCGRRQETMTIFTIGYEGIDVDTFVELLDANDIDVLVDVRELPLSRKRGFSKTALANRLNLSGFEYAHMASLGCPKPVRNRYREDGNWKHYTAGFLRHLATQQAAVKDLADWALKSNCALMCFEADHNFCHRAMVADAVSRLRGARIKHIAVTGVRTANPANRRLAFA